MRKTLYLVVILMLAAGNVDANPPVDEGKAIFINRCAACHNVNKVVLGPALAGIDDRRSLDWIVKFVQSSQTMIKSGDEQAAAVFAKFNSIPMPDHADLTAEKIKDIVAYIKSQSKPEQANTTAAFRPGKLRPSYIPVKPDNYLFFGSFFIGITLLVFSLLMLVEVKAIQRKKGEVSGLTT